MTEESSSKAEFSRPVAADSIGTQRQTREIAADAQERGRLARRFGLLALDRLDSTLELKRHAGEVVRVTGHLRADVVQSCVVSLEPVSAHIESDFELSYSAAAPHSPEVELDPMADDAPEPLVGGAIDLGEAVAQQLAVSLDPYPRAPGAAWPSPEAVPGGDEEGPRRRPFADLATLAKGSAKKRSGKP